MENPNPSSRDRRTCRKLPFIEWSDPNDPGKSYGELKAVDKGVILRDVSLAQTTNVAASSQTTEEQP